MAGTPRLDRRLLLRLRLRVRHRPPTRICAHTDKPVSNRRAHNADTANIRRASNRHTANTNTPNIRPAPYRHAERASDTKAHTRAPGPGSARPKSHAPQYVGGHRDPPTRQRP